jgi:succinoglycan biosynthesis protein ExoM
VTTRAESAPRTCVGTVATMEEPSDQRERGGDRKSPLVSLCVITYRRPKGLRRLVESLARLEFRNAPARIELIVVDNDTAGSAEGVCAKLSREVSFPIKYAVEPRRGIPMARNRSIRMIDRSSAFAVFVDDDETVAANWLDELLRVQQAYQADVVSGPVMPSFLAPPPGWIVEGRFFAPQRYRTGERILHAYTSNTLVRAAVLAELDGGFDERLALSGGSDTHFFLRVRRAGYKLVWADEAIVYDCVPRG